MCKNTLQEPQVKNNCGMTLFGRILGLKENSFCVRTGLIWFLERSQKVINNRCVKATE